MLCILKYLILKWNVPARTPKFKYNTINKQKIKSIKDWWIIFNWNLDYFTQNNFLNRLQRLLVVGIKCFYFRFTRHTILFTTLIYWTNYSIRPYREISHPNFNLQSKIIFESTSYVRQWVSTEKVNHFIKFQQQTQNQRVYIIFMVFPSQLQLLFFY